MNNTETRFITDSEKKSFDLRHRSIIHYNISKYNKAVTRGLQQFLDLPHATAKGSLIKHKTLENLEEYLIQFEKNFKKYGNTVIWASDSQDALNSIIDILENNNVETVVKSKSMTTEEVGVVPFLEGNGFEAFETDLGEYIVQISNDKPYHIVTPAMHRSAVDISGIFHEKFGLPADSKPEEITLYVRQKLRNKILNAGAAITGANFLIAETGSIVLTENEGNGVMSMSWPPVHIVIAGIEKVIPSLENLHLFLPLLASHGTGQNLTVYNSIVSGVKKANESRRHEASKMYVILLDNGRTNLLRTIPQRRALSCIRCGACLNACPVYRNIGGHSYGAVYSGPIGAVITPHLKNFKDYKHLSYASSLCGRCTEVCPMGIDLHRLLLHNRNYAVKNGNFKKPEKAAMFLWKKAMLNRWMIDKPSKEIKNFFFKHFVGRIWGKRRTPPHMKTESFNYQWKKMNPSSTKR